jgi:hypothetical protein
MNRIPTRSAFVRHPGGVVTAATASRAPGSLWQQPGMPQRPSALWDPRRSGLNSATAPWHPSSLACARTGSRAASQFDGSRLHLAKAAACESGPPRPGEYRAGAESSGGRRSLTRAGTPISEPSAGMLPRHAGSGSTHLGGSGRESGWRAR